MEHSLKEKLRAIKLCKQGLPIYHVAKKLKCSKNVVTMGWSNTNSMVL